MVIKGSSGLDSYQKVNLEATENTKKSANTTSSQVAQSNVAPKTDTVNFSEDAKFRTTAYSEAMGTSDVRAEKVTNIKSQVDSGSYSTDSMKIAAAMLSDIFADEAMFA